MKTDNMLAISSIVILFLRITTFSRLASELEDSPLNKSCASILLTIAETTLLKPLAVSATSPISRVESLNEILYEPLVPPIVALVVL